MLTLHAASTAIAPPGRRYDWDQGRLVYFRDLHRLFEIDTDDELLRSGPNVGHPELAGLLAAQASGATPPDLVICARALPDRDPTVSTASYLNCLLGNRARSFTVSEQGLGAPFTALRIADAYLRSGTALCTAVAVLEQTTLPTRDPLVQERSLIDSGVLLTLKEGGDLELASVGLALDAPAVEERLATLRRPGGRPSLLVTGPGQVLDISDGCDVHLTRPDTYCTGVWIELATHWQRWKTYYRDIVLVDTDPRSRESYTAHFTARGR